MSNSTVTPPTPSPYAQLRRSLLATPKVWLVTGVAGFIGSSLLETLLGLGQTVVGLDNFSTGFQANIDDVLAASADVGSRFRMIRGDIRDAECCRAACEGVQFVLHQAALASVPRSIDDPAASNQVNVDGTLNMFMAARAAGVERLVYATSCAVYGDAPDAPISEDWPLRPLSPYAASKASNEMYAAGFQQSYAAPITGLRYFNVYGRRQDPTGAYAGVIPLWVTALLRGAPCRIFGDGETSRDFVHVSDVVQANLLAATTASHVADGDVYNVACGESTTLTALFEVVRGAVSRIVPEVAGAQAAYEPFRPGDIKKSSANISKGRRLLGYDPVHRLRSGVAEAIDWYVRTS